MRSMLPEEGEHLAAGNRTRSLEEGLCVRNTIFLPGEVHTKWIAINDLKVTHPAVPASFRSLLLPFYHRTVMCKCHMLI